MNPPVNKKEKKMNESKMNCCKNEMLRVNPLTSGLPEEVQECTSCGAWATTHALNRAMELEELWKEIMQDKANLSFMEQVRKDEIKIHRMCKRILEDIK
jgi:hypothetical protein